MQAISSSDEVNWPAVAIIISVVGLVLSGLIHWGIAAYNYGRISKSVESNSDEIRDHSKQLKDHNKRLGHIEGKLGINIQ
jgi:uncharacterized membrane protein SpoIIM required for sporulation